MKRSLIPELESAAEQEEARRVAFVQLAEQCGEFSGSLEPGEEKFLLIKATHPGVGRIEAALKITDQLETTGLDFTYLWRVRPASETYQFVLPKNDSETGVGSHREVPISALEDAVFLTRNMEVGQPRDINEERREVYEISEQHYQQVSGQA